MRNISDYTDKYLSDDFEKEYQVKYRRQKVLDIIKCYSHSTLIEIGCGMEPIGKYIDDYDKYVIVEPSSVFADNAKDIFSDNERVTVVNDFFENYALSKNCNLAVESSMCKIYGGGGYLFYCQDCCMR